MEYNFRDIEKKWQLYWKENKIYKVEIDKSKPKFYVLDMFPYPSGSGLHVGHPLGYIASDIYSRYKRMRGFNVLHPMGYDAFGLPAEQYAIQTGQHPSITAEKNINRYREQLDKIGFSFDWDREFRTCEPSYYKWTQWAFIQMFNHYYNNSLGKADSIENLIKVFEKEGNSNINAACGQVNTFTAEQWSAFTEKEQQIILLQYRIAYLSETMVNWCEKLGTVLANDEVKEGMSVRGGYPVMQKKMMQWQLRVSAYAERLLKGLDTIEWSDSLTEIQKNWIGRSEGAEMVFKLKNIDSCLHKNNDVELTIFTTRADTVFGVTFMVLAPESDYTLKLTTASQKAEVEAYIEKVKKRTERERIAEVGNVTGVFTGVYAINPFTNEEIPIWVSDYVLTGYGTGAIMAVPAHDSRDYAFAKKFNLEIRPLIEVCDVSTESFDAKEGIMINSGFLNGMKVKEAIKKAIDKVEEIGIGKRKVNFRLRDAIFSRQRYWGEPFPIYYKDELPYVLPIEKLPLELPQVDKYEPTSDGKPPLGRAKSWSYEAFPLELSTMPGFAGSSAYYLRYMDASNNNELVSKEANQYWQDVDLYVGGTEHATGHLVYSRFWNKFLFDIGIVCKEEPFKKLINQGMIQGRSNFVYRIKGSNKFVSYGLKNDYEVTDIHVDVNIVTNDVLDIDKFKAWRPEFNDAIFILENGKYVCGWEVEKMSKSMYNVVNPDDIIEKYGADTLRLYEMFLGPIEQSKPWDTAGIDGVHRFLRKLWKLYHDTNNVFCVSDEKPNEKELKILHKTIKKAEEDILSFSFNTSVSAFMICVNELGALNCNKREILGKLIRIIAPYAPHISEELWQMLGYKESITQADYPTYNPDYLIESNIEYPVSFNGKMRFKLTLPATATAAEAESAVRNFKHISKWTEGKEIRKVIFVPNKIINVVIG